MNVLVIAPHADDEVLGVGGVMAKYLAQGHGVYVCIVTCGSSSMFQEAVLKKLRSEIQEVHQFLGITQTVLLDFSAVLLQNVPPYTINAAIGHVIEEVKPEVVFIPHHGDIHLDHQRVAQAGMVATRPIGAHKVKTVYAYETLSETEWNAPHAVNAFMPNMWMDITSTLTLKLQAMQKYATQVLNFPHPRSLEAIEALAKVRGSTVGVHAAEAFMLIRGMDEGMHV